ncbi:radical SAM family heme chaperone HemW [Bacillus sp. PS06]|uniref:radical SAM family heme chaperone HemW n=1 Tax=Bacillus sp. PS06 TaxID=2764176 RepID=UPI00177FF36B|nr:radical SAM family heme chaperone HemW [Bacillus sp. PS06]MBD8069209.1 oxygen-independent coproporphyrinogen III oxidase [Bacillus sp. PS06]
MVQAAYLHIPFCSQICHYCDFNKVFLQGQPVEEYLASMDTEMKNTVAAYPYSKLKTIFVGGGTPTVLNEHQLDFFLSSIHKHLGPIDDSIEFTFEANPGDLSIEKLKLMKDAGVNRLSFGVQTFNDQLLHAIGRTHRKADVFKSIDMAREAGFTNVSLDLIYALPKQTIADFQETLDIALTLGVEHFSAYSLIIEPKTVFYNRMRKGTLSLPSQENEATMYEILMDTMTSSNYKQYEISNFAKPGYESKHNLTYWNNEEYYGIGAGAHSYVNGKRIANAGPIKKYMTKIAETGLPYIDTNEVSINEMMEEELFLGLRKTAGVSKEHFHLKFKRELMDVFGEQITEQKSKGLLEETSDAVRLTHQGKFLGNEVFQAFIGLI